MKTKDVLSKDQSYQSPTLGNIGDVAELTAGPVTVIQEDYGFRTDKKSVAARVDE